MGLLHESNFVVIEVGSFNVKAGRADPNQLPSLVVPSQVAIVKKNPPAHQDSTEHAASEGKDGDLDPADSAQNSSEAITYLVGSQLDILDADLDLVYPFHNGNVQNWDALEAIIGYILGHLGIRKSHNESPVMVLAPLEWSKAEYEQMTQLLFEKFNVPGMFILEKPLAMLYGIGTMTGLVVDIGYELTSVCPIIDNSLQRHACQTMEVGMKDWDFYTKQLLNEDPDIRHDYKEDITDDFLDSLKSSGIFEVSTDVSGDKSATEKVEAVYGSNKFMVGTSRWKGLEIFFNPSIVKKDCKPLQATVWGAMCGCDMDRWSLLLDSIVISGGGSIFPGMPKRLKQELNNFVSHSNLSGEFQPSNVSFLKMPEYFGSYKDRSDMIGFLGGVLAAKFLFGDPKAFAHKADYNEHGPFAIHLK